jgi:C-terminal processing protease CtpA/Prc
MRKFSTILTGILLLSLSLLAADLSAKTERGGWLGVYTQTVDEDLKEAFKLESGEGVVVTMVIPESPADEADIKQGDIIIAFDGVKLTDADQLAESVGKHAPGDEVEIKFLHKGKEKTATVIIGSRDDLKADNIIIGKTSKPNIITKKFVQSKSSLSTSYLGVNLESLNSQLGEYFGVKDGEGALITMVTEDSPAQKAGLKAGDVIIEIDGKPVEEPSDVQKAIRGKQKGEKVSLTLMREKNRIMLAAELEEAPADFASPDDFVWIPDDDDLPDIDLYNLPSMPHMKWLYRGNFDDKIPDMEELQRELQELKTQMKEMMEQFKEMRRESGKE